MDNGDYEAILEFLGKKEEEEDKETTSGSKQTLLASVGEREMRDILAPLFDKYSEGVEDLLLNT